MVSGLLLSDLKIELWEILADSVVVWS